MAVEVQTQPARGDLINRSGSISTGGTAQQLCAALGSRRYLLFVNISDTTMWLDFGTTAVADQPSIPVAAGAYYELAGNFVSSQSVSVMCATTGKKFTCKEA